MCLKLSLDAFDGREEMRMGWGVRSGAEWVLNVAKGFVGEMGDMMYQLMIDGAHCVYWCVQGRASFGESSVKGSCHWRCCCGDGDEHGT
jgi:hypothetical protein